MNLHGIASGAISAVNPFIPVAVRQSTGSAEDINGKTVPTYAADINTTGQKQALTGKDLMKIDQQNVQGVVTKIYINGNYEGLFRVLDKGGDILIFENQTYLVTIVFERWPDWCALGLTMQLDGAQ